MGDSLQQDKKVATLAGVPNTLLLLLPRLFHKWDPLLGVRGLWGPRGRPGAELQNFYTCCILNMEVLAFEEDPSSTSSALPWLAIPYLKIKDLKYSGNFSSLEFCNSDQYAQELEGVVSCWGGSFG